MGLLGGGGSILTVPVLVYLFSVRPTLATGYSLFVVGSTALVGAANAARNGLVEFRTAAVFVVPSFVSVFLVRRFLIPAIPEHLAAGLTKDRATMLFFSAILLVVAAMMFRKNREKASPPEPSLGADVRLAAIGAGVGLLAGLVGAGGGFLIVPALALLAGLDMKRAVGTSLAIISVQSLIGFVGELLPNPQIDWSFLLTVTGLAVAGVFVGDAVGRRIESSRLKPAFATFILVMALVLLAKETLSP